MKNLLVAFTILLSAHISFGQDCVQELTVLNEVNIDGDGSNDDFCIDFACSVDEFHIVIFNDLGVQVFESEDANFKWDCKDANFKLLAPGTLSYKLEYRSSGDKFSEEGYFTINH